MSEQDQPIVLYATFASPEEAQRIGRALVEARLAACVNIFPQIQAIFEWEGKVEDATETAMFIKTRSSLQTQAVEEVKRLHSYDVPAVVAIEFRGGNQDYFTWIWEQTGPSA